MDFLGGYWWGYQKEVHLRIIVPFGKLTHSYGRSPFLKGDTSAQSGFIVQPAILVCRSVFFFQNLWSKSFHDQGCVQNPPVFHCMKFPSMFGDFFYIIPPLIRNPYTGYMMSITYNREPMGVDRPQHIYEIICTPLLGKCCTRSFASMKTVVSCCFSFSTVECVNFGWSLKKSSNAGGFYLDPLKLADNWLWARRKKKTETNASLSTSRGS